MSCLFCKIIAGDLPSTKVYEDDCVLAFYDIVPMAPVHVIVVPKAHIESADAITTENSSAAARIFEAIPIIAKKLGIAQSGYRVITNIGDDGGQTIEHLHFHILGGTKLPLKLG